MMRNLPKNDIIEAAPIKNVSDYIERINTYIEKHRQENYLFVYRGEPDIYSTPCRPNIFRQDLIVRNKFFEKSLFDAMRQNHLTGEKRYLDNAIDAQHGEFPSRLLDVSYNCLVALYFAVTPYYHKAEDSMDDCDGMVFLFLIDEVYSPSGKNMNDNYNAIINRDQEWYQGKSLFEKNHKFVDHTKLNNRIIAQQGAFILFPGDEPEELSEWMSYGIRIPKDRKAIIRRDLRQLFGIHTGSIYPEIINLVDELKDKSERLNTEEFSYRNELHLAMSRLDKDLDYYLDYIIKRRRSGENNSELILMHIEHVIDSYRKGLLDAKTKDEDMKKSLKEAVDRYNSLVKEFAEKLSKYDFGDFSAQLLSIDM